MKERLNYEKQEPAFLRRLRGEVAGDDGTSRRSATQRLRNSTQRNDDEDAPIYINEETNEPMSAATYAALVAQSQPGNGIQQGTPPKDDGQAAGVNASKDDGDDRSAASELFDMSRSKHGDTAKIGKLPRKRKQGIMIGGFQEDTLGSRSEHLKIAQEPSPSVKVLPPKKKKNRKVMKLSFDHD